MSDHNPDDTEPTCDLCGGPATPGGLPGEPEVDTVCPPCEDGYFAHDPVGHRAPEPPAPPAPAHGNTTR